MIFLLFHRVISDLDRFISSGITHTEHAHQPKIYSLGNSAYYKKSYEQLNKQDPTWNRFYDENISPTEYNEPDNINEPGSIYVNEVFFENFRPNGVINVTNPDYSDNKMLVSKSSFSNSFSLDNGGSIYVKYGSCIQYQVCSINSTITGKWKSGCHSYVFTTKENKSYIIESAFSKCKGSKSCIYLSRGSQLIDSTNISHAECNSNAAYYCWHPSSHRINFTSILNNIVDEDYIMHHYYDKHNVFKCNVIKNIGKTCIVFYGSLTTIHLSYCIFSSNSGEFLFYNNFEGECIVDQCFLNNKDVKISNHEIPELTTTEHLVLNLSHFSTWVCINFPLLDVKEPKISQAIFPYHYPNLFRRMRSF